MLLFADHILRSLTCKCCIAKRVAVNSNIVTRQQVDSGRKEYAVYQIGDKVVYGVVGVCEVENIDTPPIKGISGDYYFLQPVFDSKGIIYSPVDSNKVMIRSIMTVKECDKLKERARNCKKDGELSEKVTPMQYDEHMKSQNALKLMHLIRVLYVIKNERAKDLRKMKSADSRMLLAARKLLYGEFAAVYNKTFDEVAEEMDAFLSVD